MNRREHTPPNSHDVTPHVVLADVRKEYTPGVAAVDGVSLTVGRGEFFSLLGPSGCGKTTTLRLIAGLEGVTSGSVSIDGIEVANAHSHTPPEHRHVGIVFQDYALFPHMTVAENVAFGLHRKTRHEARARVRELLDLVGLASLGPSYPHEISGGQRQRVALARSLAPAPEIILLDEPFSNLDAELRGALREETRSILKSQGATTILVTHDREEAFSLSDRIGLLNNGRLEQVGASYDVYHHPSNRFVAEFTGKADFLPAAVHGDRLRTSIGEFQATSPIPHGCVRGELMIRPDDVTISEDPNGRARITYVEFLGGSALYTLRFDDDTHIHALMSSTRLLGPGLRVTAEVDLAHLVFLPDEETHDQTQE